MNGVEKILLIMLSTMMFLFLSISVFIIWHIAKAVRHSEKILDNLKGTSSNFVDIADGLKSKVLNPIVLTAISSFLVSQVKRYNKRKGTEDE